MDSKILQYLQVGTYHTLGNEGSLIADLCWIDSSEFGAAYVSVSGVSLTVNPQFKDIWAASVGIEWPGAPRWTGALGAVCISSGVDDEDRSLALPLDPIIGLEAGVRREIDKDKHWRLNLNCRDLGTNPSIPSPSRSRIVWSASTKKNSRCGWISA